MANFSAKIPTQDLTKNVVLEVTVTGYRWWCFRMRVALFLILLLARFVGGIRVNVSYATAEQHAGDTES